MKKSLRTLWKELIYYKCDKCGYRGCYDYNYDYKPCACGGSGCDNTMSGMCYNCDRVKVDAVCRKCRATTNGRMNPYTTTGNAIWVFIGLVSFFILLVIFIFLIKIAS